MSESVLLTDDHPVDPDDELLVAYLDSELSDAERDLVEKRLVGEPAFRRRLQTLQTGWDWLDDLPNESSNEKLVESTIEMVAADITPNQKRSQNWLSQNWKPIGLIALLMGCFAIGLIGSAIAKRLSLRNELSELAIAENYEAYRLGSDFEFYRQLRDNPQWSAMLKALEQVGERSMSPPSTVVDIPLEERADKIPNLASDERSRLESRWSVYQGTSEAAREKIRATAAAVDHQPDRDQLLKTMKALAAWRENLEAPVRDRLQSTDATVREQAMQEAIAATMSSLARQSSSTISDETSNRIYLWLQQLLANRLESEPGLQRTVELLSDRGLSEDRIQNHMMWLMVDHREDRGRPPGFGGPGFLGPPDGDADRRDRPRPPTEISDEELIGLTDLLDDVAFANLEALTDLPSQFVRQAAVIDTLRSWALDSIRRNSGFSDSEKQTRMDLFRQREDQDAFDLQSPELIIERLTPRSRWGRRPRSR
ncbi:hypothetical protein NHH03_14680 [Stieleria sp. TO1_6]|uniref:anti-sigma factor family protein n=1 Tax=Stieleria tagensis TaxID=2956795 RepID=UPI00209BA62D|nr:hypothetical protein [Stieleria tagensis]MCO8122991.1 hypothetical protein [Stieleria tagensis]